MCAHGNGNCYFCQLIRLGLELNRKAIEYRAHIRKLNKLIGAGNIVVSQVDPTPVVSISTSIGWRMDYDNLLRMALSPETAYQFLKGAEAILLHDFVSFNKYVTNEIIRTFFIAQLFSETGRGHLYLVLSMLNKIQDYAVGPTMVVFGGFKVTRKSTFSQQVLTDCENISKIYTKYPYMQKGGAWPGEFPSNGTRKVTTRDLFIYGVILRNLYYDIRTICDHAGIFLRRLGGFTLNLGDMGPLIRYRGEAYKYSILLKANPQLVKSALKEGMDQIINDDAVLMLLAAICISERVRGYETEVRQWVRTVRAGNGTTLPTSAFMKL